MNLPTVDQLALVPSYDPILRTPAQPVTDIATQVIPYVEKMRWLMLENRGLGISAVQVGLPFKFFLMSSKFGGATTLVINPVIVKAEGNRVWMAEGCLSFPGGRVFIARRDKIHAEWTKRDGKRGAALLLGVAARVFQHEFDHGEGICIFP